MANTTFSRLLTEILQFPDNPGPAGRYSHARVLIQTEGLNQVLNMEAEK
jgi:hypothetical protein